MKHFPRALIVVCAMAVGLGGCAGLQSVSTTVSTLSGAQVSYKQALAAVASFETLQRAGEVYLRMPVCTAVSTRVCHDRRATKTIVALSAAGRVARNKVMSFMDAHPCAAATCPLMPNGPYQGLVDAISGLNWVYATYKVAKGG